VAAHDYEAVGIVLALLVSDHIGIGEKLYIFQNLWCRNSKQQQRACLV
jgi:hypothetical protein